jgi:Protein of unknown function (DUF3987)
VTCLKQNTFESSFPVFPNAIIQGVARKFVDLYSPIRETPEGFLWLSFVAYFGNLISPHVRLDCASSEPRFFGVTIGESGRTRKSAGNNAARDLFKALESECHAQTIIEGFGSAEGMLRVLGKGQGQQNPAIVHLDEINLLAAKTDIKGSAGIAALHKLFEDHDCDHPLADGGYFVKGAYLSLIGASTLADFIKTWGTKHADAGFFSRLLIVAADVGEKRFPRPKDPDPKELASLVAEVGALFDSVRGRHLVVTLAPEAEELWAGFYDSFGSGPEWNRIDTYGLRLMAVQAVLRCEEIVTKENTQQVIDFLQYEVAVREAVKPIIAENSVAQMEESIRRHLPEGETMKKRDLQRRTNYTRFGIETFDRAITNMTRNEEIDTNTEGRSVVYTRVNSDSDQPRDTLGIGISSVIEDDEDSGKPRNSNNDAVFGSKPGNSHHAFVPEPDGIEVRIM